MHERISQSLLGGPRDEVDDDPAVELAAHIAIRQLYERLVWVEMTRQSYSPGCVARTADTALDAS